MAHHAHEPSAPATAAVMAVFPDVSTVFSAAERCRDEGFTHWDVFAPFPIHGINEAMGLKPSKVSFCMGAGALTGVAFALLLQGWTAAGGIINIPWLNQFSGYDINTAGKPFFAWEQFTPIMFELGVLFGSFGALLGMLMLNKLPRHHHPLMTNEHFLSTSDDGFVIAVEAADPKFDERETASFLKSLGATEVEVVKS
ncbi:MAG: DUF3341 domain-containing protein [Phycisphaerales bacterium]|nr:DUF3341 domain-containing protein [Phycisphaerales bacterium]